MNSFLAFFISVTALSCSLSTVSSSNDNTWAVLICGIDLYQYSYGMEAMVYKHYNLLLQQGIPAKNIILISPDSVAFHPLNQFPGIVSSSITGSPEGEPNVYANVTVDYDSSAKLTPKQFYAILSGNATEVNGTGSGRVLHCKPKDTVLMYYFGAGNFGYIFLNNDYAIFADDLIYALEELQDNKKLGKIYINMDTQNPGAMFDDLIESKNIIARSFGSRYSDLYLCHPNTILRAYTSTCSSYIHSYTLEPILKQNYKGDVTINDEYLAGRSSASLYSILGSHNMYGNLKLGSQKLSIFYGSQKSKSSKLTVSESESQVQAQQQKAAKVVKRGIPIRKALYNDDSVPEKQKKFLKHAVGEIVSKSIEGTQLTQFDIEKTPLHLAPNQYDCYKKAINGAVTHCGTKENKFILMMHTDVLAKLCIQNISHDKITTAAKNTCSQ